MRSPEPTPPLTLISFPTDTMPMATMEGALVNCGAMDGKNRQPNPSTNILNSTKEVPIKNLLSLSVVIEMRHLTRLRGISVPPVALLLSKLFDSVLVFLLLVAAVILELVSKMVPKRKYSRKLFAVID